MDDRIPRRRVLSTTAASGLAIGIAGCLADDDVDADESIDEDDEDNEDNEDDDADEPEPGAASADDESDDNGDDETDGYESGCEAGTAFLETAFDDGFDAAADYYPYEYVPDYDREAFADIAENGLGTLADEYFLTETSCDESTDDHEIIEEAKAELDAETTAAEWIEFELDLENDAETMTESVEILTAEIDGTWYAGYVDPGSPPTDHVELTVEFPAGDAQLAESATGEDAEVVVSIVDEDGGAVSDATVVATAGSATIDADEDGESYPVGRTGDDDGLAGEYELAANQAVIAFDGRQGLRDGQDSGTIELVVIPPSDSNYIDEASNPEIQVVAD